MIIGDANFNPVTFSTDYVEVDFRDRSFGYVLNSIVFKSPVSSAEVSVLIDGETFLASTGTGLSRTVQFGGMDVSGKVLRFQWPSPGLQGLAYTTPWEGGVPGLGLRIQFVTPAGQLWRGRNNWVFDLELLPAEGIGYEPVRGGDGMKSIIAGYVSDGLLDGWFQQPYLAVMTNQFGDWLMDDAGYEIPPQPGTYYPPSRGRGYPRPL